MNERKYLARAEQWGLGETSTGKEQVAVSFKILTPDADIKSIAWHGYFTPQALDRTIESLRICGWEGNDLSDLRGFDKNEVALVIDDEDYNGETRAKVKWINRAGGGLALKTPLSGDKLKAFALSMVGQIRGLDTKAQKPRSSASPPPLTDDDVPW